MTQLPCPAGVLLNFAQGLMFDEDQFQKMSIKDKILIRLWIGTATAIFTIIALHDELLEQYQRRKKATREREQ